MTEYHILNGDVLLAQFPASIQGEKIVARECLVDGAVSGESLDRFWKTRAEFMTSHYGVSATEYQEKTIPEFEKIMHIPEGSRVYLWFEYDLFCQVNCWFSLSLLPGGVSTFFVFPGHNDWRGFGIMDNQALQAAYTNKQPLQEGDKSLFIELWKYYQQDEFSALTRTADLLAGRFPKLKDTVQAHIDRFPMGKGESRPERLLAGLMHDHGKTNFGPIFKKFSEEAGVYGFGDLQVKRLLDSIPGSLPNG